MGREDVEVTIDRGATAIAEEPAKEESSILNLKESLPYEVRRRIEVLQKLESYKGKPEYKEEQVRAAKDLGVSDRSLRRMQFQYQKQGIEGIIRRERSDRGEVAVSEEWREFIEKSYRSGNRGMKRTSVAQIADMVKSRAEERGEKKYPSRATVYRLLAAKIEERETKEKKRAIGWKGEKLEITTKEGIELAIEYSNQVWQCDHTPADILVVDSQGEILGRPTMTTVIDTYSRCIVGMHLGMERPSAAVTCLALRHAILPKQYGPSYELSNEWPTYGVPQYLYTDAGADFTSNHVDQIAASLGITLCLRRRPSDGGIVERPFGTLTREFFATLPGYTTARLKGHRTKVEEEACLTLEDLERLLTRYIVDRYNQMPDARIQKQTRIGRWEAGGIVQPPVMGERELDILLMRQDRRSVYRGGHIRFANLVYKGEYLEGYAGQSVVLRYNPRDITMLMVYREEGAKDVFLTRAHAQHLDAERLSLSEAQAIGKRLRETSKEITNKSVLKEVRDRTRFVETLESERAVRSAIRDQVAEAIEEEAEKEDIFDPNLLPKIRVINLEDMPYESSV
jgi:putative transposase